jgi:hypothetical protein
MTFRRSDGAVIPNTAPLCDLLRADSVTLWMDNQKNGQRGTTIHHTACPGWFCPIKALPRRVTSIIAQGCTYGILLTYLLIPSMSPQTPKKDVLRTSNFFQDTYL